MSGICFKIIQVLGVCGGRGCGKNEIGHELIIAEMSWWVYFISTFVYARKLPQWKFFFSKKEKKSKCVGGVEIIINHH